MKIKRIYACWIYVSDLQRSQEFYRNIGFDIKVVDGDWIEFALGETSFAILKRPESKGEVVASKTRIMFEVEDIELARDESVVEQCRNDAVVAFLHRRIGES